MACKKAVPRGISIRLAGLTSREADNENTSLSDIYPKTHKALQKAGYLKNSKLPKLGEILDKRDFEMAESSIRQEEWSKDKRSVYVLESFSGHWQTPLHKTLQRLKEKYKVGWFRPRMIYKRHTNVKEMFLADLNSKIIDGIYDKKNSPKEVRLPSQK